MERTSEENLGLSAEEAAKCRALLEEERRQLLARINLHEGPSRQTAEPLPDELDQASVEVESGVLLRLLEKERKLLREIEHALGKFTDGSYGICEGTEEPIPVNRLLARPWARYSLAFKEELENLERGYAK